MAIQISDILVKLSGGALNGSPDASLGGVITTLEAGEVLSQYGSDPTTVTGVTIINGFGNAIGNGTLKWDSIATKLMWKPFGGVQFNGPAIVGDGRYVLGDSNGYLLVDVVQASLPGSTTQDADILVANYMNKVFDSVSAVESTDGLIEYRCMYLHNTHNTDTAYDVRIWVKQQPLGPDSLDLSLDLAGVGNGSTTGVAAGPLADEIDSTEVVSGANDLVWARPSTQATGLTLGNLAPGQAYAFWEKRAVPPGSTQQVSNDTSRIGISALI